MEDRQMSKCKVRPQTCTCNISVRYCQCTCTTCPSRRYRLTGSSVVNKPPANRTIPAETKDNEINHLKTIISALRAEQHDTVVNEPPANRTIPAETKDNEINHLKAFISTLREEKDAAVQSLNGELNLLKTEISRLRREKESLVQELNKTRDNLTHLQDLNKILKHKSQPAYFSPSSTETDIVPLLKHLKLDKYIELFIEEEITVEALINFNAELLDKLNLPMGPKSILLAYIQQQKKPPIIPNLSSSLVLQDISAESPEFKEVETQFKAALNNQIEDYNKNRVANKKDPITFRLKQVTRVYNDSLVAKFEQHKEALKRSNRTKSELSERIAFHGSDYLKLLGICRHGLLKVGNPLNPSTSTDSGWFGDPHYGVYVSQYADYTLKYSNKLKPLNPGDTVKILMLRVLPGRSLHITSVSKGMRPTEGYDSHTSPNYQEWFLFNEEQSCPIYLLEVEAIENRSYHSDDGNTWWWLF